MDFELTPEQRAVREEIRAFVDEVLAPSAAENARLHRFPREIVSQLAERGFLGGPIPREWGGRGYDYVSHALVAEEIGRGCSSMRSTFSAHLSLCALPIYTWGTGEQKARYLRKMARGEWLGCMGLTEPDAGSDVAGMLSTADLRGGHYVLNGRKMWISNGCVADLALVYAKTDKSQGARGITAFLVEMAWEGASAEEIRGKLGLWSSNTAELIFDNVQVPAENVLGEVGGGFKVAMSTLDYGRYTVAAGCVGLAQACLDAIQAFVRERGPALLRAPGVRETIGEMARDIDAGRLLVLRAGHLKNRGVHNTRETSVAKYFCSEMVNRAATQALQIIGLEANSERYPVERYLRDAKVNTLFEGTSQIQKLIIGAMELGIRAIT
ncbi:MAG: acyl-CoA dehydrogenase family protein [Candidatus Tectomicrobia bacterium]|nr:acyl-CoA dehydrogenase family protein [Candidatus Tectomicrobia bacterium]